ncbi:MAG: amidohydrolase family protein [Bacteroidetes bacterium]|nr:amidohydrolase family protein [Bacteroidota bacterium]
MHSLLTPLPRSLSSTSPAYVRWFTLMALLLLVPVAQAQEDVPRVTSVMALENVRVVSSPGTVAENATVLIRGGLIEAVGTNVTVPVGADRMDGGDTLTVYAGFIDGLSHIGVREADGEDGDVEDRGNPSPARAGIQPNRDVRAFLDPDDNTIRQLREQGFTAAHVMPIGRMLPGTGAVILLGGDDPDTMVLRGETAQLAQIESASGVFPSNDMAVIAQFRQTFREAERRQALEEQYAADPTGMERPSHDPVHRALFPVLSGSLPVFFHTENALDLHRVLALHDELGFPLVLTGLAQSFNALDALRAADVPLYLTLDLPEAAEEDAEEEPTPYDPALRTRTHADVAAEEENLKARLREVRQQYERTAALLHEEGFSFAFTTKDVAAGDVLAHIRRIVAAGLPADVALAALTTRPAERLGVDQQVGTVASGKIANLIVATGDLFDEDTDIHTVFVDGEAYEVEAAPAAGDAEVNPAGTWALTISSPEGNVDATVQLDGSPEALNGTITVEMVSSDPTPLDDIQINGNILTFAFTAEQFGTIRARLTLTETEANGTLTIPSLGGVPVAGTRTAGPDQSTR